jgi:hypothetical protein
MASGGGGQSTNTVQNSNAFIPDWLSSYSQQAVGRANDLSNQAYEGYTGQTVAGFDPAQMQAYQQVGNLQGFGTAPFTGAINDMSRLAGQTAPLTAQGIQGNTDQLNQAFQSNVYNPATGLLGNFASQGPMTAQGVASNAQQLMSPYQQQVLDPAMQLMQQQLGQNLNQIGANANQAGAFGGSRQGVMEGVAQSQAALGAQKYAGDLLNSQWNNALTQGGNIASQNAQQGYNANAALAQMLQQGYGGAQTLGSDIARTNQAQGLQAAGQIPGALTSMQQLMLGQTGALNQAGAQQQQYQQNILNAAQGAFAQRQAYPYQQLQTLLGAISGIPYSTSNTMFNQEFSPMYSNPWGQGIGGVAALGGLAGGVGSLLNDSGSGGNA